jgi:hypothetical protein
MSCEAAPVIGYRRLALVVLVFAGVLLASAAEAANERKPCGLHLDKYQELGKLAQFTVTLRCDAAQKEGFAVNEPLLVGLTATTSAERQNDVVEIEYDFPLQPAVVTPDTTAVTLTFHAQLGDIPGKTYVYAMAWPRVFLRDCADGRSGCMRFGYALAMPASLSQSCLKKDKYGDTELSDDFMCRGSSDYRFKFR